MGLLHKVAPRGAWHISGRPVLSLRRLIDLPYFKVKRRLELDYSFTPPADSSVPLDIFMPVVEKDAAMLEYSLRYAKENIKHPIKTIYLIAPKNSKKIQAIAKKYNCQFVAEESVLDFPKTDINYQVGDLNRNGWIYKMLINLNADTICSERYILVLDADTCFVGPQIFVHKNRPLFNLSNEYHQPYFDANRRLLGLRHRPARSFITHYMLFDAEVLKLLRQSIEQHWNKPWTQAIIDCIDKTERSGFADYELYGDYYLSTSYPRPIMNYWSNESRTVKSLDQIESIIRDMRSHFRSVSLHNYLEED